MPRIPRRRLLVPLAVVPAAACLALALWPRNPPPPRTLPELARSLSAAGYECFLVPPGSELHEGLYVRLAADGRAWDELAAVHPLHAGRGYAVVRFVGLVRNADMPEGVAWVPPFVLTGDAELVRAVADLLR